MKKANKRSGRNVKGTKVAQKPSILKDLGRFVIIRVIGNQIVEYIKPYVKDVLDAVSKINW